MSKQRWFIVIVSFAAMIGISIWITRSGIDPAAIKVKVPLWAHALAVLAVATEVLTRALKIGWSAQALRIPLPYGLSVRTCLGGDFGAAITPSRSGAEPARFLILAEGGLRPVSMMSCHQPVLPMSCSRRAPTARPGSNSARATTPLSQSPINDAPSEASTWNRKNHKNSGREARPEKLA